MGRADYFGFFVVLFLFFHRKWSLILSARSLPSICQTRLSRHFLSGTSCQRLNIMQLSCRKITSTSSIEYRNAREDDLKAISILCTETFHPDWIVWHMAPRRYLAQINLQSELQDRFVRYIGSGRQHAMLVAVNRTSQNIVGFAEVGMLPSPEQIKRTNETSQLSRRPDVPYLGNLAVCQSSRRLGIGSNLVYLSTKLVEKWYSSKANTSRNNAFNFLFADADSIPLSASTDQLEQPPQVALYVVVEAENQVAMSMYEKLGFLCIPMPRSTADVDDAGYNVIHGDENEQDRSRVFMKKVISFARINKEE